MATTNELLIKVFNHYKLYGADITKQYIKNSGMNKRLKESNIIKILNIDNYSQQIYTSDFKVGNFKFSNTDHRLTLESDAEPSNSLTWLKENLKSYMHIYDFDLEFNLSVITANELELNYKIVGRSKIEVGTDRNIYPIGFQGYKTHIGFEHFIYDEFVYDLKLVPNDLYNMITDVFEINLDSYLTEHYCYFNNDLPRITSNLCIKHFREDSQIRNKIGASDNDCLFTMMLLENFNS
ncbi:hypothetical protein [Vreelandella titanicae]|uniref:Uncharacterized protein n=1 Tax=Vreelandella titanicae TaxID=664683 RepID=A0AAP9NN52_9GAMM|nr:hypothetical protein [Halomonas titanicae]QKS24624.1 hypothetical protein FX987_02406 [Halomonas titanicae]